jgi:hypothetical protein
MALFPLSSHLPSHRKYGAMKLTFGVLDIYKIVSSPGLEGTKAGEDEYKKGTKLELSSTQADTQQKGCC